MEYSTTFAMVKDFDRISYGVDDSLDRVWILPLCGTGW